MIYKHARPRESRWIAILIAGLILLAAVCVSLILFDWLCDYLKSRPITWTWC